MADTLIKVDLNGSAYDNDKIHNRWHPDIPIVESVEPGDDFIIETVDWTSCWPVASPTTLSGTTIDNSRSHFFNSNSRPERQSPTMNINRRKLLGSGLLGGAAAATLPLSSFA